MKEEKQERLFRAIGDVGGDLVDLAEKQTFAPSPWRKWGSLAACLAVLLCLGALAMPYFPMGCGSSSSDGGANLSSGSAMQDAAAETEAAVDEAPAADEPETAESPAEAGKDYGTPGVQPTAREQLIFRNTVYYLEAVYSDAEGEAVLGEYLGTVEDGDRPEWTGCPVYSYHSYDKDQTEAPVDILVEVADGYLYCVTYQLQASAPFDLADTLYLLEHGGETIVAQQYAAVLEAADFIFDDPSELSADQLAEFFLLTLQMEREAGIRTADLDKYLWYDGRNQCYEVPAEDAARQLDRYLAGYARDFGEASAWDPEREALVFDNLTVPVCEDPLNLFAWDYQSGVLSLTVERVREGDMVYLHLYILEFTDDACLFRSITPYSIDN